MNLRGELMIGVISDTHIPRRSKGGLPQEVKNGLQGVDMILHAGDILEESVLKDLEQIAPVYAVYGNCDPASLREKLPMKRVVEYKGFKIGMCHGNSPISGRIGKLLDTFAADEVDAIVYGHSHKPHNDRINDILIFNPGSPTDKRFEVYYSYGIISINQDKLVGKVKYFK